jgi:hypothetical protein
MKGDAGQQNTFDLRSSAVLAICLRVFADSSFVLARTQKIRLSEKEKEIAGNFKK